MTTGRLLIDGTDIRDYEARSLRNQVGMVLQDTFLFSETIRENIAIGKPDATLEEIIEAAKAANAHEFIMGFPEGYETRVGERGVKLSGGQKRRISIARVFLKNPPLLILDEATSALDLESEHYIQEAMDKLAKDRTTLLSPTAYRPSHMRIRLLSWKTAQSLKSEPMMNSWTMTVSTSTYLPFKT